MAARRFFVAGRLRKRSLLGLGVAPLMTTREAAHYLHVYGIQAVYGLIKTRDLPFRLVGKGYRFAQHELDAWSTRHRQVRESGSHDTKVATKADSATATALNP